MKKRTFGAIALVCLLLPLLFLAAAVDVPRMMTQRGYGRGPSQSGADAAGVSRDLETIRGDLVLAVYAGDAGAVREAEKKLKAVLAASPTLRERFDGDLGWIADFESNLGALSAVCGRASLLVAQGSLEEAARLARSEILPLFRRTEQSLEQGLPAGKETWTSENAAGIRHGALWYAASLVLTGCLTAICWRILVRAAAPMREAARALDRFRSGEEIAPISGGRCREGAALAEAVNRLTDAVTADVRALSESLDMEREVPSGLAAGPLAQLGSGLQKLLGGWHASLGRLSAFSERTAQEAEKLAAGAKEALDGAAVRAGLTQDLLDAAEKLMQALREGAAALPRQEAETEQSGRQCAERLWLLLTGLIEGERSTVLDRRLSAAVQRAGRLTVLAAGEQNGRTAARSEELRLLTVEWMTVSREIKHRAAAREQMLQDCMSETRALVNLFDARALEKEAQKKRETADRESFLRLCGGLDRFISAAKAAAEAALAGTAQAELIADKAAALAEGAAELRCAGTILSVRLGTQKSAGQSVRLGPGVTYTVLPDPGEEPSEPPKG